MSNLSRYKSHRILHERSGAFQYEFKETYFGLQFQLQYYASGPFQYFQSELYAPQGFNKQKKLLNGNFIARFTLMPSSIQDQCFSIGFASELYIGHQVARQKKKPKWFVMQM